MRRLLWSTAALAAAIFIVGSATTNALFLASLGRTGREAAIFAGLSIAADLAKVVLPVAIGCAIAARAWFPGFLAALMLGAVIALSIASGTGFAALTRGVVAADRAATTTRLAALEADRAELRQRLSRVTFARETAVIAAALTATTNDRRWQASKQCAEPGGSTLRQFCSEALQLGIEAAAAGERTRLTAEERALRQVIETLRVGGGSITGDPQVEALAALLGVEQETLRAGLTLSLALVMELGAIVLVLLLEGPLLRDAKPPGVPEPAKAPARTLVELPPQADRSFWLRQRAQRVAGSTGGGHDEAR